MREQEKINFIKLAKQVAVLGGKEALNYFRDPRLRIQNKSSKLFDPVTAADLASENKMRSYIRKARPLDTVIGEEKGISPGSSEFTWVLDPIDGTRAFVAGIPVWTVLVSLSWNNLPILGVIYQPFTKELFIGGLGISEYIRDNISTETSVRNCDNLKEAFLSSTFPEIGTAMERKAFEAVAGRVKICRYGLDAYAYALLAVGQLDIVVESGLKSYDVQAPIALIEAAGGIVTNWRGGSAVDGGRIVASGDKHLHANIVNILSNFVQ